MTEPIHTQIREARLAAKLTQTTLAALAGITQGHLSEIESGKRPIPREVLFALADALGVSAVTAGGGWQIVPAEVAERILREVREAD